MKIARAMGRKGTQMMTESEYKQAEKDFLNQLFPMNDQVATETLGRLKETLEHITEADDGFDFSDEIRAIDYAVEKLRGNE